MQLPQAIVDAAVREFTRTSGNVSLWDRMNTILELAADDIVKYAMDVQVHPRHVSCPDCDVTAGHEARLAADSFDQGMSGYRPPD